MTAGLLDLCDELLLEILHLLDLPDLFTCLRTCHRLRTLSLDPILHAHRLQQASLQLSCSLSHRPALSSLRPPHHTIYLTSTHFAARKISRSLISIKLSRSLLHRPSAESLVENNILPRECVKREGKTTVWGGPVAPAIVETKRKVEKELVKDGLRAWLVDKAEVVEEKAKLEECDEKRRPCVRLLVQRYARRERGLGKEREYRWGRGARERRWTREPTRAHVAALKRFWEKVARGGGVSSV